MKQSRIVQHRDLDHCVSWRSVYCKTPSLTIAPVTIIVFSSARPTVAAILVCPDAAKARSATTMRADTLVTFFGVEVQLNKLAIRIKAVWIRLVESNHARFFGRDW